MHRVNRVVPSRYSFLLCTLEVVGGNLLLAAQKAEEAAGYEFDRVLKVYTCVFFGLSLLFIYLFLQLCDSSIIIILSCFE